MAGPHRDPVCGMQVADDGPHRFAHGGTPGFDGLSRGKKPGRKQLRQFLVSQLRQDGAIGGVFPAVAIPLAGRGKCIKKEHAVFAGHLTKPLPGYYRSAGRYRSHASERVLHGRIAVDDRVSHIQTGLIRWVQHLDANLVFAAG